MGIEGHRIIEQGDLPRGEYKKLLEMFNEFIIENHDDIRGVLLFATTGVSESDEGTNRAMTYTGGDPNVIAETLAITLQSQDDLLPVLAAAIVLSGKRPEFLSKLMALEVKAKIITDIKRRRGGDITVPKLFDNDKKED